MCNNAGGCSLDVGAATRTPQGSVLFMTGGSLGEFIQKANNSFPNTSLYSVLHVVFSLNCGGVEVQGRHKNTCDFSGSS